MKHSAAKTMLLAIACLTLTPAIPKPTHRSNYGVKLQQRLQAIGGQNELVYPDAPDVVHPTIADYLIRHLK